MNAWEVCKKRLFEPLAHFGVHFGLLGLLCFASFSLAQSVPLTHYELGFRAWQSGQHALAVQQFTQALNDASHLPTSKQGAAHYYLGNSLQHLKRLPEAKTHYLQALVVAPGSPIAAQSRLALNAVTSASRLSPVTSRVNGYKPLASKTVTGELEAEKLLGLPAEGVHYFDKIRYNGKRIRWSLSKQPVSVYIEQNPKGLTHFSTEFPRVVAEALRPWEKALGNQLRMLVVPTPQEADILVRFTNGVDKASVENASGKSIYTAGLTEPVLNENRLERMEVRLATLDVRGTPLNSEALYDVALHELGHAFGLLGHSESPNDVMHAESNRAVDAKRSVLSAADVTTLRMLYNQRWDVSNVLPGSVKPQQNAEEELATWASIERDVSKQEKEATERPTTFNWTNCANAYLEAARWLSQHKTKAVAEGKQSAIEQSPKALVEKSLKAAETAIGIDAANASAYQVRGLSYEVLGQLPEALKDAETVVRLRPGEKKSLLQQAWLQSKAGQVLAAKNTLSAYLNLAPNGKEDPFYQKVKRSLP